MAPDDGAVVAPVVLFELEFLVMREWYLLNLESVERGEFAFKLCQVDGCVYFISKEDGFLLEDVGAAGSGCHEEVAGGNSGCSRT